MDLGFQKNWIEAAKDLPSMSAIFVSKDFWDEFMERSNLHPSLKRLLSDIRLELFSDQGQGPTFKYSASKWGHTQENVRDRLEYLANLFERCAAVRINSCIICPHRIFKKKEARASQRIYI